MTASESLAPDQIKKYCEILGVGPGATADQVKKRFRVRIKELHPDKLQYQNQNTAGNSTKISAQKKEQASLVIEAYRILKKGVPSFFSETNGSASYDHRAWGGQASSASSSEFGATWAGRRGYDAGEKIFTNLFRSIDAETYIRLHRKLYGFDPTFFRDRASSPRHSSANASAESAPMYHDDHDSGTTTCSDFERADKALVNVIACYHRSSTRSNKMRLREYIRELTHVQILYRDVSKLHPGHSAQSMRRVRQIHSLIAELKPILRG